MNRKSDCQEWELQNTFRVVMIQAHEQADVITKLFFPQIMRQILCDTTKAMREESLLSAGMVMMEGIKDVCKQFGMNEGRLKMIRITLSKAVTRAIIQEPYQNYAITTFRNFVDHKLPKPMPQRMQIKERFTTLMGLKQLLRKLRKSVWQKPLKGQRKAIHGMSQQITQLLAVTEANKYNEGDNLSMEEKCKSRMTLNQPSRESISTQSTSRNLRISCQNIEKKSKN